MTPALWVAVCGCAAGLAAPATAELAADRDRAPAHGWPDLAAHIIELESLRATPTPYRPPVHGHVWTCPGLPHGPRPAEAALWSWILLPEAPDELFESIRSVIVDFNADEAGFRGELVAPLMEMAVELSRVRNDLEITEWVAPQRAFFQERNSIVRRFGSRDDSLIRELAGRIPTVATIAAATPERLEIIAATRSSLRTAVFPSKLAPCDVDLLLVVAATDLAEPFVRRVPTEFDIALLRAATELANLRQQWIDLSIRMMADEPARWLAARQTGESPDDAIRPLNARRVGIEEAIIRATRQGADELARHVEPADAHRLRTEVRKRMFPELYPIHADLAPAAIAVDGHLQRLRQTGAIDEATESELLAATRLLWDGAARQADELDRMQEAVMRFRRAEAVERHRIPELEAETLLAIEPQRDIMRRHAVDALIEIDRLHEAVRDLEAIRSLRAVLLPAAIDR